MGTERVDSIYDIPALQAEQDAFIGFLKQSKEAIIDLNNQRITVKGSNLSEFPQAQKDLQTAIDKTNASTAAATTAAANYDKAQKAQAAATKAAATEARTANKIQNDLANTYKQFSLAAAEASIKAKTYSLELGANHPITIQATKDALEMNTKLKDLDATTGVYNRNVGNYSSALTGYANTLRGLRGPTKLLGEALGVGATVADQFRLIIEHSLQGLAALSRGKEESATAAAENAAATATDTAATAANTAASTTNTTATSTNTGVISANTIATEAGAVAETELAVATTAASTSMRIFKVAIASTGIGLLLVALGFIVYKIIEYRKSLSEANEMTKMFAEVNADAAKEAGKEAGSLRVLQAEIENTLIPMDKRLQAIKNLRDEYPELLKNTTDEALLQGKAAEAYDLVSASILKKAQAQAAEAKIQALVSEQLDISLKSQEALDKKNLAKRNAKDDIQVSSGGSAPGLGGNLGGVSATAKKQKLDQDFNVQKEADQKEIDARQKKIDALLKLAAVEENITTDKTKKEKPAASNKDSTKDLLDKDFELYKQDQTERIALYKADVDNQKLSYEERLMALSFYNQSRQELIEETAKNEIRKEDDKEKALQDNYKTAKANERKNILIEIKNTETAKAKIQNQAAIDERAVNAENAKEMEAITKQQNEAYLKSQKAKYDKAIQLIEDEKNKENAANENKYGEALLALQSKNDAGILSDKEFNKERLRLEFAHKVTSLEIEADRAKRIIAVRALLGQDVSKEMAEVAKLEREIQQASLDFVKKSEAEKRAEMIKTLNAIQKVANDVFSVIDGLLNAKLTTEKNALADQQDAAEKKAARDIEIVNASTASEEYKAAKIIMINARLQAQKDQIAIKEKQAGLEKARFEKATAIFNIILNTAAAVVKALPNIPLAIAVGILGAAQLAEAIATPLPKYRGGRGYGKEEFALVHEGEFIKREDGSIEPTPKVESLTHLMPKDRVLPNKQALMRELAMSALPSVAPKVNQAADIERIASRIEDAIGGISFHSTVLQDGELRKYIMRKDQYDKWVNTYIKN